MRSLCNLYAVYLWSNLTRGTLIDFATRKMYLQVFLENPVTFFQSRLFQSMDLLHLIQRVSRKIVKLPTSRDTPSWLRRSPPDTVMISSPELVSTNCRRLLFLLGTRDFVTCDLSLSTLESILSCTNLIVARESRGMTLTRSAATTRTRVLTALSSSTSSMTTLSHSEPRHWPSAHEGLRPRGRPSRNPWHRSPSPYRGKGSRS